MLIPNNIIEKFSSFLLERNNLISSIKYLAYTDENGDIKIPVGLSGEYEVITIDDRFGNHAYIRYRSSGGPEWTINQSTRKPPTGCIEIREIIQNLRLVVIMISGTEIQILADKMLNDFLGWMPESQRGYEDISVEPVSVSLDPEEIFLEETKGLKQGFNPRIQLLAIDFQLKFSYLYDKCKRIAVSQS
jgi:hypothetical protein